jgi:hypothetical protein
MISGRNTVKTKQITGMHALLVTKKTNLLNMNTTMYVMRIATFVDMQEKSRISLKRNIAEMKRDIGMHVPMKTVMKEQTLHPTAMGKMLFVRIADM